MTRLLLALLLTGCATPPVPNTCTYVCRGAVPEACYCLEDELESELKNLTTPLKKNEP